MILAMESELLLNLNHDLIFSSFFIFLFSINEMVYLICTSLRLLTTIRPYQINDLASIKNL